jgi:hypothetical protein
MSLENAFNYALSIISRKVTFERPGVIDEIEIVVSPSNYQRKLAGPEDVTVSGREFVISARLLKSKGITEVKEGDRITDPEYGLRMVTDVKELYDLGANVIGFRVRTG